MANKRIRVITSPVASQYEAQGERIIEFMDPVTRQGGLISFSRTEEGLLYVSVYRHDAKVVVKECTR